jgi:hypothetical protein
VSLEYKKNVGQTPDHGPHPPYPASVVIMIGEEAGNVVEASFIRSP